MKLKNYLLRVLILTMSLTMPMLACSQERKDKAASKKTMVTQKKPDKDARRTPKNKQKAAAPKNKKKQPKTNIRKRAKQTWADKHFIALKTNVPFDALAVQNLALEVELHPHITIDFPVMWSIADVERRHGLKTVAFQPEGRWWLKPAQEGGHFFGLHTHLAWFNLKWDDDRYETRKRPLMGVGVSYGYRLPLGKHWGAEANIGLGYANMKYNTFYNIENGAKIDTRIRNYWGLTRAGLSLVYRF